jgi:hypothetical protein
MTRKSPPFGPRRGRPPRGLGEIKPQSLRAVDPVAVGIARRAEPSVSNPPPTPRDPRVVNLLIAGGSEWPTLTIHGAITDAQWEQMLDGLRAVKSLVVEPSE